MRMTIGKARRWTSDQSYSDRLRRVYDRRCVSLRGVDRAFSAPRSVASLRTARYHRTTQPETEGSERVMKSLGELQREKLAAASTQKHLDSKIELIETFMRMFQNHSSADIREAAVDVQRVRCRADDASNRWDSGYLGRLVIHEWAHTCGWDHGDDHGVPGDSGRVE